MRDEREKKERIDGNRRDQQEQSHAQATRNWGPQHSSGTGLKRTGRL